MTWTLFAWLLLFFLRLTMTSPAHTGASVVAPVDGLEVPTISTIYVYDGDGAGEGSKKMLEWALRTYSDPSVHTVEFITPEEIIEGSWRADASLLALPGGYDCGYVDKLGKEGTDIIRTYIDSGGSYLGMCAGGYFGADRIVFDEDGPLEVVGVRDLKFFPGVCEGPVYDGFEYGTERGAHAPYVRWNLGLGDDPEYHNVFIYFNGGGKFISDVDLEHDLTGELDYLKAAAVNERIRTSDPSGCGLNVTKDKQLEDKLHSLQHNSIHKKQLGSLRPNVHECITLARYMEKPSHPAAIVKCKVGSGVAILTGIHFEWNVDAMDKSDPYLEDVIPKLKHSQPKQSQWMHSILTHLGVHPA